MPFDSQQFLQELQAIMQQQRPPRPDSYSAADSAVDVFVIPTNEEWMIARHTQALLGL